jgi:hypothetical protein
MEHHCYCEIWNGSNCTCEDGKSNLPKTQSTVRFHYHTGMFFRQQVKEEILNAAYNIGVDVHIEENKGIFNATYYVTVKGDSEKVGVFTNAVEKYFKKIDELNG